MNKKQLIQEIEHLSKNIIRVEKSASLATLQHQLDRRQVLIESLFESYSEQLIQSDIELLNDIKNTSTKLILKMESDKLNRGDEIIKHKNKGSRIRLYTSIAKQK